jgi:hypothetical protein
MSTAGPKNLVSAKASRRRNKVIVVVFFCVVFAAVVLYGIVSVRDQTQTALKVRHDSKPKDAPHAMETEPGSFTLTKAVTIQVPYGSLTLPVGTRLPLVSREDEDVIFRYVDGDYSIPISSTDLR